MPPAELCVTSDVVLCLGQHLRLARPSRIDYNPTICLSAHRDGRGAACGPLRPREMKSQDVRESCGTSVSKFRMRRVGLGTSSGLKQIYLVTFGSAPPIRRLHSWCRRRGAPRIAKCMNTCLRLSPSPCPLPPPPLGPGCLDLGWGVSTRAHERKPRGQMREGRALRGQTLPLKP